MIKAVIILALCGLAFSAKLSGIDLELTGNSLFHHTERYESSSKQLIVRRAQEFNITLEYDGELDLESNGSLTATVQFEKFEPKNIDLPIDGDWNPQNNNWTGRIIEFENGTITIQLQAPAKAAIGRWNVKLNLDSDGELSSVQDRFVLLFNPFSEDDQVYMGEEDRRNEYAMNDVGMVWVGWSPKRWVYGQYVDVVLETVLNLLEDPNKYPLNEEQRGDVKLVARAISSLVNVNDNEGIVWGRWSGSYSDGKAPFEWSSSVAIIKQYNETRRGVKYGQCWVFAATTTSVCRTLGLPARPVTNLGSAHDTDNSMTIDKFYDTTGSTVRSGDSTWNFHVWGEAWFARDDIPAQYSGWQVIDATPQEKSDGLMQAGPGSVIAVQRGDVEHKYDLHFIWAEVSALTINWVKDPKTPLGWRKTKTTELETGLKVLTKQVGSNAEEDITHEYKHVDFAERRAALNNAFKRAGVEIFLDDLELDDSDVTCDLAEVPQAMIGSDFVIRLNCQNDGNSTMTLNAIIRANSNYYNGMVHKEVAVKRETRLLQPDQNTTFELSIPANEYLPKLVAHNLIKIFSMVQVNETNQILTDDSSVQFMAPELKITAIGAARVGQPIKLQIELDNPLNVELTNCTISAQGYLRYSSFKVPNVAAKGHMKTEIEVGVDRANYKDKMIMFKSNELTDTWGHVKLNIVG